MDMRLPDGSGAEACRAILARVPQGRVVMLTIHADEAAVLSAITSGAVGYVLKESDPQLLIDAVNAAAEGKSLLDPAVTPIVLDSLRRSQASAVPNQLSKLSAQEERILQLIAGGHTNRQIAAVLCLSEYTIKSYVSGLFRKLGIDRRSQAAALASSLPTRPPARPDD
jgi:DNA-binding NarL/FixJ family response regulator